MRRRKPHVLARPRAPPLAAVNPLQRRALDQRRDRRPRDLRRSAPPLSAATGEGLPEAPVTSPTPSTSPPPVCTPLWEIVPSADRGDLPITLNGVVALSASEAWAVGAAGDPLAPSSTSIQRWDGAAWTAVNAPSPGSERNGLLGVDAAGPNEVWAVGRTSSGFGDRAARPALRRHHVVRGRAAERDRRRAERRRGDLTERRLGGGLRRRRGGLARAGPGAALGRRAVGRRRARARRRRSARACSATSTRSSPTDLWVGGLPPRPARRDPSFRRGGVGGHGGGDAGSDRGDRGGRAATTCGRWARRSSTSTGTAWSSVSNVRAGGLLFGVSRSSDRRTCGRSGSRPERGGHHEDAREPLQRRAVAAHQRRRRRRFRGARRRSTPCPTGPCSPSATGTSRRAAGRSPIRGATCVASG